MRSQSSAAAPLGLKAGYRSTSRIVLKLDRTLLPIFREETRLTDPRDNGIADTCRERT